MRSATLQSAAAAPPVAAAPPSQAAQLQPVGQDFVPAAAGVPGVDPNAATAAQQRAPDGGARAAQQGAEPKGIPAEQGLAALAQQYGEDFTPPIVASDGNVYMASKTPVDSGGKIALRYHLVARIDRSTGRMLVNGEFIDGQKSKAEGSAQRQKAQPRKIDDRFFWETFTKGPDGKRISQLEPMTEQELQSYAAQAQQSQQQQWTQDRYDWVRKLGQIGTLMKIGGYSGSFLDGLSRGPDPMTGKAQTHWMTGYMVLQMLDSQVEGKLLPQWMKTGPVGTAVEWGVQGLFMLDMGRDLSVLAQAMPRSAAFMRAFTAPTRAVFGGVAGALRGVAAATAPAATGAAGATGAATGAMASMTGRMGMAGEAMAHVAAAGQAAAGASRAGAMSGAIQQLGTELGQGKIAIVGAPGTMLADKVAVMNAEGALQLVPKAAVYEGVKAVTPPLTGGMKVQQAVTSGIHGAFGAMRPFLRTLQVGGSIFGTIASGMHTLAVLKNQGPKALLMTRDGRSALFGFLGSATFLGIMALPLVVPALGPNIAVAASGLNVLSNVFSGVSMLSYAGLFGEGGFLDHDAVRAAFLIPPLTPLGLAAMLLKRREQDAKKKVEAQQAAQSQAADALRQQRGQLEAQIQQAGQVAGAQRLQDGSMVVQTGVAMDLSSFGPAPGGQGAAPQQGGQPQPQGQGQQAQAPVDGGLSRTLQLIARPMLR